MILNPPGNDSVNKANKIVGLITTLFARMKSSKVADVNSEIVLTPDSLRLYQRSNDRQ